MIELKDDEIKKVAEITGVSYYDIQKLYTRGCKLNCVSKE